ncbi:hypothetical protein C8F01DRAFT_208170 [Mycena amicta]|nr:hypothetical protein C8F01DRAFT_208170 [Mycena amicta]
MLMLRGFELGQSGPSLRSETIRWSELSRGGRSTSSFSPFPEGDIDMSSNCFRRTVSPSLEFIVRDTRLECVLPFRPSHRPRSSASSFLLRGYQPTSADVTSTSPSPILALAVPEAYHGSPLLLGYKDVSASPWDVFQLSTCPYSVSRSHRSLRLCLPRLSSPLAPYRLRLSFEHANSARPSDGLVSDTGRRGTRCTQRPRRARMRAVCTVAMSQSQCLRLLRGTSFRLPFRRASSPSARPSTYAQCYINSSLCLQFRPRSLHTHPPPTPLSTMIYSARAIVPPNGFIPYGGRRVAVPPSSSSPNPARRRSSVVQLLADILPVVRTAKAEPLRRQRAQQGSPSMDACSPHVAQMKALGGVPLCRQRAHRGISSESSCPFDSAVQAKLLPVGGVPMCRQRAHRGSDTYAS